ncbi:TetR/AcrR family transcriptional regulator [Gordonia neofelifaecis]|uniref:Regulatory protein TetR n=1 Tax=Gordonia neofelifaecis NRRL B-59395 TaxID=644548 RepID=F1YJ27_9ACTN|nr:TetR/AcrR family transcriptional regulator [Gordonia neofelifaecis]EGD55485.1 regulatory protein TetR [Gordonia neofelifaecis NRRL B-59395]
METSESTNTTRARLLDAAERLLATVPYDDLSVRAVCAEAGANPAAVHYHFGSKESLVAALLQDRLEPEWSDQLDRLESGPRTISDIIDAILEPLIALQAAPHTAPTIRVLAQFVLAHPEAEWNSRWFQLDVWTDLLTSTVPGLDPDVARRRWRFAFVVLMTELAAPQEISPDNLSALSDFLIAGLAGLPKGIR